jgi:hypothetical protein
MIHSNDWHLAAARRREVIERSWQGAYVSGASSPRFHWLNRCSRALRTIPALLAGFRSTKTTVRRQEA